MIKNKIFLKKVDRKKKKMEKDASKYFPYLIHLHPL